MTITQSYKHHLMYPAIGKPVEVTSDDQRVELEAKGYTLSYQHQAFPTTVYKHGKDKIVQTADDLAVAVKDGWSQTPPAPAES